MNPQTAQPPTPDWSQAYPATSPMQSPQVNAPSQPQIFPLEQPASHTMLPAPVSTTSPQAGALAPSLSAQNPYVAVGQPVGMSPSTVPEPTPTPSPLSAQPMTAHVVASQTSPSVQDEASDSVLDEEWVEKAKQIILRTKGDPYAQGQELAKIKAQYIKARYNKDIKMGEI